MISIIIPTLNEENYLPQLLACLKKQTIKNFEVIIADAGSTDETINIAEKYNARVVEGGLPAVGRNNGASHAKYDFLVFIDSDIKFNEEFLEETISIFRNKNLDLACAYYNFKSVNSKMLRLNFFGWNLWQKIIQYTSFPMSSSQVMLVKKDSFLKLDGFDENIKISEDIDIIKRFARNKYKFRMINTKYEPSIRRFEKYGLVKPVLAGFVGSWLVYLNIARNIKYQNIVEFIYGGWGKW